MTDIMIPSIFSEREIDRVKPIIENVAAAIFKEAGFSTSYSIGCMLDTPRACMRADMVAKRGVDIMCFDLNALTQHTFGCSKTDMDRVAVRIIIELVNMYRKIRFILKL